MSAHGPTPDVQSSLKVKKTVFQADNGKEVDIFSVSLGGESMPLLPLRNWGQLDIHKWVSRGRLPSSPPGLEVTPDHVKIAGDTVLVVDPDGCVKLEKAFLEWLALEKETLELARRKAQAKPAAAVVDETAHAPQPMRYQVEVDKTGQVHVRCTQGKEVLATIGLNVAGFKSLVNQGLMRKPRDVKVGALHDWVEIDGVFYSFEKGNNAAPVLERALNEQYLPHLSAGEGKDVVIYENAASSTGFDIQFPTSAGGIRENRRRSLNEDALELLQDPIKCGLLHKGIVIKLTRPTLIFKFRTPDGGERYLDNSPENVVSVTDEDGNEKYIDLSKPVNYMHLSPAELTAIFNHPALHKHSKAAPRTSGSNGPQKAAAGAAAQSVATVPAPAPAPVATTAPSVPPLVTPGAPKPPPAPAPAPAAAPPPARSMAPPEAVSVPPTTPSRPALRPNEWLRPMLEQPPIRHDWLSFLLYGEMAATFGNSSPGYLGLSSCWASAQDQEQTQDVSDPEFKGIFRTEKGGFGFVNQGHIARFNQGVAFVGTQDAALEGIDVNLIAAGVDEEQRLVFVVSENYRSKFGVQEQALAQELKKLEDFGAVILTIKEVLESTLPLVVLWTVPAVQENPQDPKAVESWRQEATSVSELASTGTDTGI